MGLLLRLVLLGVIVWIVFRLLQRALGLGGPQRPEVERPGQQVMRRCAFCRVHVPESESTRSRERFFCCEAHRDAFFREPR